MEFVALGCCAAAPVVLLPRVFYPQQWADAKTRTWSQSQRRKVSQQFDSMRRSGSEVRPRCCIHQSHLKMTLMVRTTHEHLPEVTGLNFICSILLWFNRFYNFSKSPSAHLSSESENNSGSGSYHLNRVNHEPSPTVGT